MGGLVEEYRLIRPIWLWYRIRQVAQYTQQIHNMKENMSTVRAGCAHTFNRLQVPNM